MTLTDILTIQSEYKAKYSDTNKVEEINNRWERKIKIEEDI